MVSFSCEVCNDTVLKKKLQQHQRQCRGAYFTCIDCSTTFYGNDHTSHTSCISEAEKYEKGLFKGKKKQQQQQPQKQKQQPKKVESKKVESKKVESKKEEPKKEEPKKEEPKKEEPKKVESKEFDLSKYISAKPTSLYQIFKSAKKDNKKLADKSDFLKNVKVTQNKDGSLQLSI